MKSPLLLSPMVVAIALSVAPLMSHARFDAAAAPAADPSASSQEATTDRVIVRYRSTTSSQQTLRSRQSADVAANRQGVRIRALRVMHNGSQVMQLSRHMQPDELAVLMQSLRSGDPSIDHQFDAILARVAGAAHSGGVSGDHR